MYATSKRTFVATISALLLIGAAMSARAGEKKEKPPAAQSNDAQKAGQKVDMKVTEKGFEPANLTVKKGQPVTLVITRITEKTCATSIVIDEYGIKTALPLNTPVEVSFTPKKAGDLKFGCAMGKMVGGVLTVQ
jgi:plastocyanin domain-containing protein